MLVSRAHRGFLQSKDHEHPQRRDGGHINSSDARPVGPYAATHLQRGQVGMPSDARDADGIRCGIGMLWAFAISLPIFVIAYAIWRLV